MRLTVIPSDNTIILDGRVLVFPFSADADLHAIQWHDTYGYVETKAGKQYKTESLDDVQSFIDAFTAEAALRDAPKPSKVKTPAELDKEASDLALVNLTKLRADTYPDVLDFLATLPGASKVIKDAAAVAAAEKVKVK